MTEEKRFAVLIDAENVSAKYIKYILDELTNYGVATYKRIYGDWTNQSNSSWKDVLLDNSITPIQQYSYTQGKNATDSAMIIDAMDILYSRNVEGFCIVSSDSDFTKLATRLRESGMFVVGMGEKKTPKPFIASCNEFKYLDVLAETEKKIDDAKKDEVKPESEVKVENTANNKTTKQENNESKTMTDLEIIKKEVYRMINKLDEEDQSMNIGEIGSKLVRKYPDFDVRNYGYTKLSRLLRNFDFLKIESKSKSGIWVTLKLDQASQSTPVKKTRRITKKK